MRKRAKLHPSISKVRSALSNGSSLLLGDFDGRTAWMRRFRDLLCNLEADLGGVEFLSEAQKAIVRRAATLELQLEAMEAVFARQNGIATPRQLNRYQRASNSQRRLFEALGLHQGRKQRDVTPSLHEYIAGKSGKGLEAVGEP